MPETDYEGPIPGDASILSADHDDLVKGLYELRSRFNAITPDERVILEAAIMMLEYLPEYAEASPAEGSYMTIAAEQTAVADKVTKKNRVYPIKWKSEDFLRLICSGGFELWDGRLVPRF